MASPGSAANESRSIPGAFHRSSYIWAGSLIFSSIISLTSAQRLEARTLGDRDTITVVTGFDAFVLQRRRRRPASIPPLLHRSAGARSDPLHLPIKWADAEKK